MLNCVNLLTIILINLINNVNPIFIIKDALQKQVQLSLLIYHYLSFSLKNAMFPRFKWKQMLLFYVQNTCVDQTYLALEMKTFFNRNQRLKKCTVNNILNGYQIIDNYTVKDQCQINNPFQECQ
ncbi:unnamed protein product [Paramecium sonneborni]|uniref:Transmembrane protein n=1 Tax=Paramecium sonneborni TaxID=65129 RepID=A0A8S1R152_9CILI|nr:unnamed protein product [Paramecium sonneborni]